MFRQDFHDKEARRDVERRQQRGRLIGGLFLIGAGVLFLARELGADLPDWLFTWKTLLIALGLVAGAKNSFRPSGWLVVVFVGLGLLLTDLYPDLEIKPFLWPAVLIVGGLIIIFQPYRPRNRWSEKDDEKNTGI